MSVLNTNATKDIWVSQAAGSPFGNGKSDRLQVGYMSVSGDDWINRCFLQFDLDKGVTAPAGISQVLLKLKVRGTQSCSTMGANPRVFAERVTGSSTINENAETRECGLTHTASPPANSEYPGPAVTTTNRGFYTGSPATGDVITIDVTALYIDALNGLAGTTGTFVIRLIAADGTGSAYDEGTSSRRIAFNSRESGSGVPSIEITYDTNSAPSAGNTSRAVNTVAGTPVTLDGSGGLVPSFKGPFSDPDGDVMLNPSGLYIKVGTTSGGSEMWNSGWVSYTSISSGVWTKTYGGSALGRGVTYYWTYQVKDAPGAASPVSSVYQFTFNALPVATKVSPLSGTLAKIVNLASDLSAWTSAGSWAKTFFDWSVNEGQSAYRVRIYSLVTLGTLLHDSGKVVSSATDYTSTYALVLGTEYFWTIEVWDVTGESGGESSRTGFKVRWGQAIYEFAVGASANYQFTAPATPASTQSAFFYRSATGAAGAGAGAWKSAIGDVVPGSWINVMVRLSTDVAGTQPTLPSMTLTYTGGTSQPEQWNLTGSADFALDPDKYRFGSRSLKGVISANATFRHIFPWRFVDGDDIPVQPNTTYTFSAWAKTNGVMSVGAYLRLTIFPGGQTSAALMSGSTTNGGRVDNTVADPEGWHRLAMQYTTGPSETLLRLALSYVPGAAGIGDTFWWDAVKFEEGTVATPWAPGWMGPAVVVDSYGLVVDASGGARFRLRGSSGGTADTVEIGSQGLRLNAATEVGEMAAPATPAAGLVKFYASADASARLRQKNDSGHDFALSGVGWQPTAYGLGFGHESIQNNSVNLAVVAAGVGGIWAAPVLLVAPMYLTTVQVWSMDTTLLRTAEARVYVDGGGAAMDFVPGTDMTLSFTPTVVSVRGLTPSVSPTVLSAGVYWFVIRNTSAAQTFGLGTISQGTMTSSKVGKFSASGAALGATLDVGALSTQGNALMVRFLGRLGAGGSSNW